MDKTGIGIGTKAILWACILAVGAVGFYYVSGNSNKADTKDGRSVLVTGMWLPSPRQPDGVNIFVIVGKSNKVDRTFRIAPFNERYAAESGDVVLIRVRLQGTNNATMIGCSVKVDGLPEYEDHRTPVPAGGFIECSTTVP